YRSLENPYFFFVNEIVANQPYKALLSHIQKIFEVQEDTDLNVDVAFHYVLSRDQKLWSIQLSMLGSYAAIWRVVGYGEVLEVIDPSTQPLSAVEVELMNILENHGVRVLDEASLEIRVPFTLSYIPESGVRLYHALFGDYDPLPWR
ncbi:MAG TPA: hypothetical protein VGD58_08800, partial [Herpetosiphonaceae bacterium]